MSGDDPIVLERVSKRFGAFAALSEVSLRLPRGAFVLVAGPNGAGKSTLLRLMAGLSRPSGGRVLVEGAQPHRTPAARARIGLLSHQTLLYDDLSARENLLFFARLYQVPRPRERVAQVLAEMDLEARQHQRVRTFSRGMRQRLSLGRATLHRPSILLFDEPYTGLDRRAAEALGRRLRQFKTQGYTTVLVTHRMDEAVQLMDHLALLKRGYLDYQAPWGGADLGALELLYAEHLEEA